MYFLNVVTNIMLKNVVNNNKIIFFNIFETEKGAMFLSIN